MFVLGGLLLGNSGKEIRKAALIVNLVHKRQRGKTQKEIETILGKTYRRYPTFDVGLTKVMDNVVYR